MITRGLTMKRFGFVFLACLSWAAHAEWIQVPVKSTKDAVFYDPKTIGVYENYRKVWLLFNFAKPLSVGSEQGLSKSGYYKVDCKSQKYSMVAEIISSQPGGEGKILQRTQIEEDKWAHYGNDETWKVVADNVCTR